MDIRVYLDGQEYISEWYHGEQVAELEDCLEEAGDSESQRQNCLDKGFYFSYPVHEAGIPLRFKYYAYRWDYHYAEQMHHKYLVIDGRLLATGSYNLSDNAEHNTIENMIIIERALFPELVDAYEANFEAIWQTGLADGTYEALVDLILNTDDPIPVVFDSMALDWDQVTYLKGLIRDHCPDINSSDWRANPERYQTCYR
jgi:phosphatidylserine/phosphatidylglycerophosphate/cardiolipin synthase-like enzyme